MKKSNLLIFLVPLLATGCFKTREEIAREKNDQEVRSTLQQNIVEYNQGLDRVQSDLGRLQGRIEEIEHQRRKEMSGFTSNLTKNSESDRKTLEDLRAKVAGLQEGQNTLFEEIKRLKEDNLQLAKQLSERPAAPAPVPANAKKKVKDNGGASFEGAIAAYKAKDYKSAAEGFRAFLEAHPKNKRALDARFFLGDCLYKSKDYAEAVVEFGVVHEKAGTSDLGRRSTLRIAQSFKAMGKDKDAKAFAQILVQTAPQSEEAKKAKGLLK